MEVFDGKKRYLLLITIIIRCETIQDIDGKILKMYEFNLY